MRRELGTKGIFVFEQSSASGFRQMTSWRKPIKTVDDFSGLRVRTIPSVIFVDLFKALGAAPTPIDSTEMYTAMQTHLVDAIEDPLGVIESYRLHEVTKYISVTNHIWGGYGLAANNVAWNALPPDIQTVVRRNRREVHPARAPRHRCRERFGIRQVTAPGPDIQHSRHEQHALAPRYLLCALEKRLWSDGLGPSRSGGRQVVLTGTTEIGSQGVLAAGPKRRSPPYLSARQEEQASSAKPR